MIELHKYSGAGNTFVVLDGRGEDVSSFRRPEVISDLCKRFGLPEAHGPVRPFGAIPPTTWAPPGKPGTCPTPCESPQGTFALTGAVTGDHAVRGLPANLTAKPADGLMILGADAEADFSMEFYNPDGTGGMMCGNGGRCIVAFADSLGIRPADGKLYRFRAPDGPHEAEILSRSDGRLTVRLKMIDVHEFYPVLDGWFVNTGTRHFVKFVPDSDAVDVDSEGRRLRWNEAFAPIGANVNFVSLDPDGALRVRTFEKGVEGETLACGTGITASALAAYLASRERGKNIIDLFGHRERGKSFLGQKKCPRNSFPPFSTIPTHTASLPAPTGNPVSFMIQARQDRLSVDFIPEADSFTEVYLTGPAEEL